MLGSCIQSIRNYNVTFFFFDFPGYQSIQPYVLSMLTRAGEVSLVGRHEHQRVRRAPGLSLGRARAANLGMNSRNLTQYGKARELKFFFNFAPKHSQSFPPPLALASTPYSIAYSGLREGILPVVWWAWRAVRVFLVCCVVSATFFPKPFVSGLCQPTISSSGLPGRDRSLSSKVLRLTGE